jgi:hypothetical protein
VKPKTARTLFGAALTLYFLWVAALASLVVVSPYRPADGKLRPPKARDPFPRTLNQRQTEPEPRPDPSLILLDPSP